MTRVESLGYCAACGRRWNALGQAHCARCCAHFSSDSAFDLHLGRIPESGPPPCKDPAKLRRRDGTPSLVLRDGIWHRPGERPSRVREGAARTTGMDSPGRTSPIAVPATPDRHSGGETP